MKKLHYHKNGVPVSDFEISNYVDMIMQPEFTEIHFSTALVIDEIRARVKEGTLNPDDFEIWIEGHTLFYIDRDGRSNDWTKSLEVSTNILTRLL